MSGESFEFFIKMRLVVEMRLVGHKRPIHWLRWIQAMQDMLKAIQACYFFRSPTDQPFELCDQVFLADADLITQGSNRRRATMFGNLCECTLYDRHPIRYFTEASQQEMF